MDFITGGVYMLLRSWSRDGLAVPASEMAELAYSLMPGLIDTRRAKSSR
jgi:hypothetical protein